MSKQHPTHATTWKRIGSCWRAFVGVFEKHLSLIEFIGLCVAIAVLITYRHANDLTLEAINLNEKGLTLNQEGIKAAQDSVIANQKSIELTQKSIDLTQQSIAAAQKANEISQKVFEVTQQMEADNKAEIDAAQKQAQAAQEELKIAQQSYDISTKSLRAATAPIVSIQITGMEIRKDPVRAGMLLIINYVLSNDSENPAMNVNTDCVIDNIGETYSGVIDLDGLGDDPNRIMIKPKEKISEFSSIMAADVVDLKTKIDNGVQVISYNVIYYDINGNGLGFEETFRKVDGKFLQENYQPSTFYKDWNDFIGKHFDKMRPKDKTPAVK